MKCYNCGFNQLVYNTASDSYVCNKCGYKHQKQYFFISHSHLDIEKVRIVRNVIEETFFYEPILFFLKCLSNENEINDLLKREIFERVWFVYCKSENAERSTYVQFERNYIEELVRNGKKINVFEIDLDKYNVWDEECANYIREQIKHKVKRTSVFLSYPVDKRECANELATKLMYRGFTVFYDLKTVSFGNWFVQIENEIQKNSYKNGAFLAIITKNGLNSSSFNREIQQAIDNNACIIPLIITDSLQEKQEVINQTLLKFPLFLGKEILAVCENELDVAFEKIIHYLLNY